MSDAEKNKLVTINIDGKDVEVPAGTNIIEAAAGIGVEIPHYCYHPKLSVVGNCRMCLVEMGMPMRDRESGKTILDDDGKPKIGWMPKPTIACGSNAAPGMHIRTDTDAVRDCQKGTMEFLLVNHPLDCPVCDQAGECRLQEFATDYGCGYSRFVEEKNVKPKRTRIGPRITLDDERCILCSRCIRFCDEVIGESILGFIDRGSYSTLTTYPGRELDSNYSLNTVDICPVGALTSTDFRFKMRVWFLKSVDSICTESSVGVNTEVWSREGKIYRITPRRNDDVNDTWMADSGRELYKQVESPNRLTRFLTDGHPANVSTALDRAVELIRAGKAAIVANGHLSVEEQHTLKTLAAKTGAPVHLLSHTAAGDGMLISADRTPNVRGALVTGLSDSLPTETLPDELKQGIEDGSLGTLLVLGEDLVARGIAPERLKKLNVVYFGTTSNPTAEAARVVLPTLTVFEKGGSFINQQFRLQRFRQAVPPPAGLLPDRILLSRLAALVANEHVEDPSLEAIWSILQQEIAELAAISFTTIPSTGVVIDQQRWHKLEFVEGESLHYKPRQEVVAAD